MTEITDLSPTDSSNTSVSGESLDGAIANMGRMDNTLQATMGMLARSIRTNVMRFLDNTDDTKRVALDLSNISPSTTRTITVGNADVTLRPQAWEQIGAEIVVASPTAAVGFSSLGSYKTLRITGIFLPNTDGAALGFRSGVGGGDSGANYAYNYILASSSVVTGPLSASQTLAGITSGTGSAATREASLTVVITNFNKVSYTKYTGQMFNSDSSGNLATATIGGRHSLSQAENYLELVANTGLIGAGSSFVLEGIRG